jgi:hypothetical protein
MISETDGGTETRFTHLGLIPEYECFDVCSDAWGFYVNTSLRSLITTGAGQPNGRRRPRLPLEERVIRQGRQETAARLPQDRRAGTTSTSP